MNAHSVDQDQKSAKLVFDYSVKEDRNVKEEHYQPRQPSECYRKIWQIRLVSFSTVGSCLVFAREDKWGIILTLLNSIIALIYLIVLTTD